MTSRRRTRKVGLNRIDAALDSLAEMGFSRVLVRKTVRNLLQTYGGSEGWTFIEDGSYKLVIETILREQEEALSKNAEPKCLEISASEIEDTNCKEAMDNIPHPQEDNVVKERCSVSGCANPALNPAPIKKRRKPCFGWISDDDDDEDDDVICLPPLS